MILQALCEYYESLLAQGKISAPGWNKAPVSFALVLERDGSLRSLLPLEVPTQRGKKEQLMPQQMVLPAAVKRSSGIAANFLWDNPNYLLGLDTKGDAARARRCFAASAQLHQQLLGALNDAAARAICAFFGSWQPQQAAEHPALQPYLETLRVGGNLVFYYDGAYIHQLPQLAAAWQQYYDAETDAVEMTCLVTGRRAPIALTHPAIKNVPGAQSSGANLISFNAPAFESFGHNGDQGLNAPVSKYAAFAYTTALNYLLQDAQQRQSVGDTVAVFWAANAEPAYQDAYQQWLNGWTDEGVSDRDLKALLTRIAAGESIDWDGVRLQPRTPFYILGLAPNAARLSVRFFLSGSFGDFSANLRRHYERLEIVRPGYDRQEVLPPWKLLAETVNPAAQKKVCSPRLAGDYLRAVLQDRPYPALLLNNVTLRIRAERELTRGKAALLKAYWLRNGSDPQQKEVMTVELNETSNYLPYVLGRLFSVLEDIQQGANPGVNATIRDKYFNAACATPSGVFPLLLKLSNSHLRVLRRSNPGRAINNEKQLQELISRLESEFPARLDLPQQGAFQIGYYHQTQSRYVKKTAADSNESATDI